MKSLKVKLEHLRNPYNYEISSKYELWGKIEITYDLHKLLDIQWNTLDFIIWFSACKEYLDKEIFPFKIIGSIAKSRDILFDRDNFISEEEEESYYNKLEDYFQHHFFKLKGTDSTIFYLGLIDENTGEISYKMKENYYQYNFTIVYNN